MTLDHLSCGTHDLAATRYVHEGQFDFALIIHEQLLMAEGGRVEPIFFSTAAAIVPWSLGSGSIERRGGGGGIAGSQSLHLLLFR